MGIVWISMVGSVAQKVGIYVRDLCAIALSQIQDSPVKSVKEVIGLPDVHLWYTQITNSIRRIIDSPQDDGAVGVAFTEDLKDPREIRAEILYRTGANSPSWAQGGDKIVPPNR